MIAIAVWAGCLLIARAWAEAPVTVTIATQPRGTAIPADFVGLSFGMKSLLPDGNGGHFFSPTNRALITVFQNLGISHLRVGGTTVESPPATPIPGNTDIDSLFAFADAAGVKKIIYSLRLLETNATQQCATTNAAIARYIWNNYRSRLDCFAIGNEPDRKSVYQQDIEITNFASYLAKWQRFAAAVTNAVPMARFSGPDAGSANIDWTTRFADREKDFGIISVITEHFYVGGKGRGVAGPEGIEAILSPAWVAANQKLYDGMAAPVLACGLPYRFTEANDHYSGGVPEASDTFAGALWALDFLHWWVAHGASGVNFHNTQWVVNDVITLDSNHQPKINPKGYGIRAFSLGGKGGTEPVTISNPAGINLTAYAVRDSADHFVTIINKEHGAASQEAKVTIVPAGTAQRAEILYLCAPKGDVTSKTGVTLGGASLGNEKPWNGEWKPATLDRSGQCTVKVPAASAAIVRISTRQ